jgi:hypothetical protein
MVIEEPIAKPAIRPVFVFFRFASLVGQLIE